MRLAVVLVLLGGLAGRVTAQDEAPMFHGSEAYRDFRLAGYDLVDEKMIDIDSDGLLDALVVERSEQGLGFSAWLAVEEGDYKLLSRAPASQANSVARFEKVKLNDNDVAILLDVYEDSPDEADHAVRLFLLNSGGFRQVFSDSYRILHSEEDAGRPARRVVNLGEAKVGLRLGARKSNWPRIIVSHDPKLISVRGRQGRRSWFVIGIRERIYDEERGKYVKTTERYLDFLEMIRPVNLTATSHLPSSESMWEVKSLTDGKLKTGWIEGQPGPGKGESATLSFKDKVPIRLVRVVPGCAGSADDWQHRNRVSRFSLMFEGGIMVHVDRGEAAEPDQRVEANDDFALPGLGFGVQTMVFFSEPILSRWVKLTIEEVEPGGAGGDESCIAEMSVHRALIDLTR